ncbi:SLATT domain-containing protein [Pseudomonas protegens]|uniref:SLATT domain-containing protein n=1 Tax=Pseudomonas protegens TaxID=380021 RepID=UPI000E1F3F14|nr:SLATT domain-containing protein [Pseudomonas protegens]AXK51967.1 SLATT domain-containing protein [Pseudomonas protegens]
MTEDELVKKWRIGICCLRKAHFHCANYFALWNSFAGGALIFLSALATAVAYSLLKFELFKVGWYDAILPVVGMLTTIVAGLQAYFRFAERAERHRAAGANFARLEMETESLLASLDAKNLDADSRHKKIEWLKSKWIRYTIGAPLIPMWIQKKHCGHLELKDCCSESMKRQLQE